MTRPGDTYHPKMGDYLGDLSDELKGGEILEFVAGGKCSIDIYCT